MGPHTRVAEMEFKGRNKCVYMTAAGYDGTDGAGGGGGGGAVPCGTCDGGTGVDKAAVI